MGKSWLNVGACMCLKLFESITCNSKLTLWCRSCKPAIRKHQEKLERGTKLYG